MLRNRGIRTKLLAVLALPIVVLIIGAAFISAQGFTRAGQAAKVEKLADGAGSLGDLIMRLHQERTLSLAAVRGKGNPKQLAQLKGAQEATDKAVPTRVSSCRAWAWTRCRTRPSRPSRRRRPAHMQLPEAP